MKTTKGCLIRYITVVSLFTLGSPLGVAQVSPYSVASPYSRGEVVHTYRNLYACDFRNYAWNDDNRQYLSLESEIDAVGTNEAMLMAKASAYAVAVKKNPHDPVALFGMVYPLVVINEHQKPNGMSKEIIAVRGALTAAIIYAPHTYEIGRFIFYTFRFDNNYINSPQDPDIIGHLGMSLLRHSPNDYVVRWSLASYDLNCGKFSESASLLTDLIKKNPQDRRYHSALAVDLDSEYRLYRRPDDKTGAIAEYQACLKQTPLGTDSYRYIQQRIERLKN